MIDPWKRQPVPIRFDADCLVRMRDWCRKNGVSLAAMVRQAVREFLDAQEKRT